MYDMASDGWVSKEELSTLLNQIPKELLRDREGSSSISSNGRHDDPNAVGLGTSYGSMESDSSSMAMSTSSHDSHVMINNTSTKDTKTNDIMNTHGNNYSKDEIPVTISALSTAPISDTEVSIDGDGDGGYATDRTGQSEALESIEDVDMYTNHDLAEKAFEHYDLTHEGRLTYEEFKMWVEENPIVLEVIEATLPLGNKSVTELRDRKVVPNASIKYPSKRPGGSSVIDSPQVGEVTNQHSSFLALRRKNSGKGASLASRSPGAFLSSPSPINNRSHTDENSVTGGTIYGNASIPSDHSTGQGINISPTFEGDSEVECLRLLEQAANTTNNAESKLMIQELLSNLASLPTSIELKRENTADFYANLYNSLVAKEGCLWKRGQSILHAWTKRYYILSGNCVYYFQQQYDARPKGVIFLTGCIIESCTDKEHEESGYYGFEVIHQDLCTGEHHRHDRRVLYTQSAEDRSQWVTALRHSAHVIPIEDDYVIGRELGRGRFSTVHECVHKKSKIRFAVKIIDKTSIAQEEKALLRTEIAVLKLVRHPNIINMEGVYESRDKIYIVTDLLEGGELFEQINGRPRFSEEEAAQLVRPLLEAVAYLHDLGIVHRDIKPENILCGADMHNVKIADFGLSKMVVPLEQMNSACGTLSYVAPEVLSMSGYGKEADLWSVGVVMYLVLCGRLPFDGCNQQEIINNTRFGEFKVQTASWKKLTEETKQLIKDLLCKDPASRISARDALKSPFISKFSVNSHHNDPHQKKSETSNNIKR